MTMHVKQAGVWKQVNEFNVKQSGVWKDVNSGFVKEGGVWKQFFSSVVSVNVSATVGGSPIYSIDETASPNAYINIQAFRANGTILQVNLAQVTGYPFVSSGDISPSQLVSSSGVDVTINNDSANVAFYAVADATAAHHPEGLEYFVVQALENGAVIGQSSMITVNDNSVNFCRWPQFGLC